LSSISNRFLRAPRLAHPPLTSTQTTINPWYHQSNPAVAPGPDTDVTRPRADFELAAIRRYAESKQVRLWTWVHQGALRGRVEEAFTAFEELGWSGMMVDFFYHDDQDSVEFAESILEAAARHRILIHFRGVWKPTGWQRTYPNLMNHEGALNLEYLVADYPTAYEGRPGFDFLKLVPTWWDETKVLAGEVGELLVTARRKGAVWYVGGLSAKRPRALAVPLSFLGEGHYTARIWKDAPDVQVDPNRLVIETAGFTSADALKVHLALDGGFVAQLTPPGN
jgi:hypothetical protein